MTSTELHAWRTSRALTLDALAAKLGVDRQTVWRWEAGKRSLPPYLALALTALDASLPVTA